MFFGRRASPYGGTALGLKIRLVQLTFAQKELHGLLLQTLRKVPACAGTSKSDSKKSKKTCGPFEKQPAPSYTPSFLESRLSWALDPECRILTHTRPSGARLPTAPLRPFAAPKGPASSLRRTSASWRARSPRMRILYHAYVLPYEGALTMARRGTM